MVNDFSCHKNLPRYSRSCDRCDATRSCMLPRYLLKNTVMNELSTRTCGSGDLNAIFMASTTSVSFVRLHCEFSLKCSSSLLLHSARPLLLSFCCHWYCVDSFTYILGRCWVKQSGSNSQATVNQAVDNNWSLLRSGQNSPEEVPPQQLKHDKACTAA